jgi:hypothetical protein
MPGCYPARRPLVFGLSSFNFFLIIKSDCLIRFARCRASGVVILTKTFDEIQFVFANFNVLKIVRLVFQDFDGVSGLQKRIGLFAVFDGAQVKLNRGE